MYKIAFINSGKAYLPEFSVYKEYWEKKGFSVSIVEKSNEEILKKFDVEWHLMGIDSIPKKSNRIKIHEYISLSVPPFAMLKNRFKSILNVTPDLRIFGSEYVRKGFGFKDNISYCYRDAGVAESFFNVRGGVKVEYDFVYVGSTSKVRNTHLLFEAFLKRLPMCNMLVVGNPPKKINYSIQSCKRINFTGSVRYQEVPNILRRARYGINYMPNIEPFNKQRSLKMLEYCASGLPVITSSYEWVNEFEKERGAAFFKVNNDLSNLKMNLIDSFDYVNPDISDLKWGNILEASGISKWLHTELLNR